MLDNARDEKIHELNFPGGEQGRAALCRHTARPKPRVGNRPPQGKLIANRANRFNDLAGNASNLDLSLLIHRFALAL